jgi:perosamine synthetase
MASEVGLDGGPPKREGDYAEMTRTFIPVNNPVLTGNEKTYVMDCLESSWISSSGKYVEQFETTFAEFCGVKNAISCCNGTAALHLALLALGLEPGDEVIIPTLTFIATANAVAYCGGKPVFVDSEPDTWNMDPELIEEKVTPQTKGILAVHLRGNPSDMDTILAIAHRHGLFVVEDAAQAHGAEYKGRKAGSIGNVGTFSFFGNKIITSGEGGMVVTDDDAVADKVLLFKNQGMTTQNRYWHPVVGYNYRMTNVAAAIGLAQLERVDWQIKGRSDVASWYRECLGDIPGLLWQAEKEWARRVWFLFTLVLDGYSASIRGDLMSDLLKHGIDTRPFYHPLHAMPPYLNESRTGSFPVAERISPKGVNLPTWAGMTREDVQYICDTISGYLNISKVGGLS